MPTEPAPATDQSFGILLVDDEPNVVAGLKRQLCHVDHAVITAENSRAGLARILADKPDIVVCDISMPELTGLELLDVLRREHPERADLPFIFLSALADRQAVVTGREHGADDYLTKPVDYDLLKATIDSRLNRAKQTTTLKEKQFVRLFKKLSEGGAVPAAAPEPDEDQKALQRLRDLTVEPLSGRIALLMLEEMVPDYPGLAPSVRGYFQTVLEYLIKLQTSAQDVRLRLREDEGDIPARRPLAAHRAAFVVALAGPSQARPGGAPLPDPLAQRLGGVKEIEHPPLGVLLELGMTVKSS